MVSSDDEKSATPITSRKKFVRLKPTSLSIHSSLYSIDEHSNEADMNINPNVNLNETELENNNPNDTDIENINVSPDNTPFDEFKAQDAFNVFDIPDTQIEHNNSEPVHAFPLESTNGIGNGIGIGIGRLGVGVNGNVNHCNHHDRDHGRDRPTLVNNNTSMSYSQTTTANSYLSSVIPNDINITIYTDDGGVINMNDNEEKEGKEKETKKDTDKESTNKMDKEQNNTRVKLSSNTTFLPLKAGGLTATLHNLRSLTLHRARKGVESTTDSITKTETSIQSNNDSETNANANRNVNVNGNINNSINIANGTNSNANTENPDEVDSQAIAPREIPLTRLQQHVNSTSPKSPITPFSPNGSPGGMDNLTLGVAAISEGSNGSDPSTAPNSVPVSPGMSPAISPGISPGNSPQQTARDGTHNKKLSNLNIGISVVNNNNSNDNNINSNNYKSVQNNGKFGNKDGNYSNRPNSASSYSYRSQRGGGRRSKNRNTFENEFSQSNISSRPSSFNSQKDKISKRWGELQMRTYRYLPNILKVHKILNYSWLPVNTELQSKNIVYAMKYIIDAYLGRENAPKLNISHRVFANILKVFADVESNEQLNKEISNKMENYKRDEKSFDIVDDIDKMLNIFDEAWIEIWNLVRTNQISRFRS